MNKITTKEMEHLLYENLWQQGRYICFEVKMPNENGRYMQNDERVDALSYETKGIWRFFELKLTKSDFHSDAKITFYGHYNYYVMPKELYEQVADEIPDWVGVYVVWQGKYRNNIELAKRPKKRELGVDHTMLMFSLMQALSRENQKYRKILKSHDRGQSVQVRNTKYEPVLKESDKLKSDQSLIRKFDDFDFCGKCSHRTRVIFEEDSKECQKCYRNSYELHDAFELDTQLYE
jgi:hypothetical protein